MTTTPLRLVVLTCWVVILGVVAHGQAPAPEKEQPPILDRYGDPLPEGALVRLGTVRFRHQGPVKALAYSPDGKLLASGDNNGVLRLWEASTGKEVRKFPKHTSGTHSLAFTPDGKTLASMNNLGLMSLWEVATGKELRQLQGPGQISFAGHALALSPDGTLLAAGDPDKAICLWEVATGKITRRMEGHQTLVRSVAFTPDGKLLASAGASRPDHEIRLWDVATGKEVRKLPATPPFAFTPDGKALAARSDYAALRLWDVATGKVLHEVADERPDASGPLAFSEDGQTLAWIASRTKEIVFWDLAEKKEMRRVGGGVSRVDALTFAPGGKTLASGGYDRLVHQWDVATGKEFSPGVGHRSAVFSLAMFPDGKTVASASRQETFLWDPVRGRERRTITAAAPIAVSPDGKTLASASALNDDFALVLWDAATGKELWRATGHQHYIRAVAFSPDGQRLATASWDTTVRVWEAATGKEVKRLIGHKGVLHALAFSSDGKTLASSGYDASIRLWDLTSGKEVRQLRVSGPNVSAVAFSPDGRLLATGNPEREVVLWQVATGEVTRKLAGHTSSVQALAFSADGLTLASGGYDGTVRYWEVPTGAEVLPARGADFPVYGVAFAPDGRSLLTGSADSTAMIWDLTGRRTARQVDAPRLTPQELESLWKDLADADARRAHAALWAMAGARGQGERFLKEKLRPAEAPSAERLKRLLADLESAQFPVRQKATEELEQLGDMAAAALRTALAGKPPLEVRQRLERLLERADDLARSPEHLRAVRAVRVLEKLGSAEAGQVLTSLAGGAESSRLTHQAKAALDRRGR